ncbi:MAG TPA: N-formylglutamate amidohydrolase [Burkholderiales bacterium]|nr:N-formylglutamate amidohydrolase [Burkholderiales bacterium]
MVAPDVELIVSCEHGGNEVPPPYGEFFLRAQKLLLTHRGYDPGALELAREFAQALGCALFFSTVSRLLVELNRSPGHPQLFSRYVPPEARGELFARYYRPYRDAVERAVAEALGRGRRVVHLSCHSFTPRLAGARRLADVGLLYDPRHPGEAALCGAWQLDLRRREPQLCVRRNYPYRGWADALTTSLRARFGAERYLGIEVEVNQKYPRANGGRWRALRRSLVESFIERRAAGPATA